MIEPLKILDTFAGIGGFSYAAHELVGGFETTQFVEIDPFCQKVLKKHFPRVPCHDDIKTFTAFPGQYDVITGGFPCQDISVAGRREGITEQSRSGLFYELIRVIRLVRPKFVVMENVAAILNNGLDIVLGELSQAGYDAEWAIVSCEDMGGCHRRQRWWCVAYPNSKGMEGRIMEFSEKLQISPHSRKAHSFSSEEFTNPNNNGLSSTEKCRINEETVNGTSQGQNAVSQSQRGSEPKGSESFQSASNTSYSYGSRTQGNWSKEYKSVWTNAFLNSSQRRTLRRDWSRYVSEPCLRRGDDGLRGRMDRLKSLGNSVSPPVAAIPLQRVYDLYYK